MDEFAKPKRKPGRQKGERQDASHLKYTENQVRMKLASKIGIARAPVRGMAKSTKFCNYDIAILSKIHFENLNKFKRGKINFGPVMLARVIEVLDLIDSGCITKIQSGKYEYHDKPVVAPTREMRVSLTGGKILEGVKTVKPPEKFPSFDKLFG